MNTITLIRYARSQALAMRLGVVLPVAGPAIGLSAFCRGLEGLGYDTLWVGDRLVAGGYPGR
ncbi:hypothetical protein [Catenuloplanes japonicus]|uniref:hypothetical protein n=1 Tax=Catenuloplanes japonicus TaxID=33876 RepID=UPI0018DC7A9D|nr:hypothetical protein [Catenuloplanes japonicus]